MFGVILGTSCNGHVCNESKDRRYIVMECERSSAIAGARVVWSVLSLQLPWNGCRSPWSGALTTLGPGQMRGPDGVVFMHVHATFWSRDDAKLFLSAITVSSNHKPSY